MRYLYKMRTRMERRGFDPKGRLYVACCRAYDAVHTLTIYFHHASIGKADVKWNAPDVLTGRTSETKVE